MDLPRGSEFSFGLFEGEQTVGASVPPQKRPNSAQHSFSAGSSEVLLGLRAKVRGRVHQPSTARLAREPVGADQSAPHGYGYLLTSIAARAVPSAGRRTTPLPDSKDGSNCMVDCGSMKAPRAMLARPTNAAAPHPITAPVRPNRRLRTGQTEPRWPL